MNDSKSLHRKFLVIIITVIMWEKNIKANKIKFQAKQLNYNTLAQLHS